MLTIYSQPDSGNCYKPRLLLAKLGEAVPSCDGFGAGWIDAHA